MTTSELLNILKIQNVRLECQENILWVHTPGDEELVPALRDAAKRNKPVRHTVAPIILLD